MDKPHEIELLQTFLKLQHKLGKSEEQLSQMLEDCFVWFAEKRLKDKLHTMVDKLAAEKLAGLIQLSISEEVAEVLNTA